MTTPTSIPPIKLSEEFLRVLGMKEQEAYALRPAFATRFERLNSKCKWIPRALLLSTEGILRVFEIGTGRITHAWDLVHVASESEAHDPESLPATVIAFRTLSMAIEKDPDTLQRQVIRLTGECRSTNPEQHLFKDELVLRIANGTSQTALSFAAAVKFFASRRDGGSRDASFSIQRVQESIEATAIAAMEDEIPSRGDSSSGTARRQKRNAVARSFRIFDDRVSSIRELGRRELQEETSPVVVPTVSPQPLPTGADLQRGEEELPLLSRGLDAHAADDSDLVGNNVGKSTSRSDGEDLLQRLCLPALVAVPMREQMEVHVPETFASVLRNKAEELAYLWDRNAEAIVRIQLLRTVQADARKRRDADIRLLQRTTGIVRVSAETIQEYQAELTDTVREMAARLMTPAPVFDEAAFHNEHLALLDARDERLDELDALRRSIRVAEDTLARPLAVDPVHTMAVEESKRLMDRLAYLQNAAAQRLRQQALEKERLLREVDTECTAALEAQEAEIARLQRILHKLQSVFVLSDELTLSGVSDTVTIPSCSVSFAVPEDERVRKLAMKLDLL